MYVINVTIIEGMAPRTHRRGRRDDVLVVVGDALDEINRGEAHSVTITTIDDDDDDD